MNIFTEGRDTAGITKLIAEGGIDKLEDKDVLLTLCRINDRINRVKAVQSNLEAYTDAMLDSGADYKDSTVVHMSESIDRYGEELSLLNEAKTQVLCRIASL